MSSSSSYKQYVSKILGTSGQRWCTYSSIACLWEPQPDDTGLGNTPDDKDDISLPANILKRHRPSKLIQQTTSIDSQTRERHSLGTHFERQDFNRVQGLQRGKAEREDSAKHEDHGDGGFGGTCVCGVVEDAAGCGHADPYDCTASHAGEHKAASAHSVDECGSHEGKYELEACVSQVDIGLLDGLVVASSVQHGADEV